MFKDVFVLKKSSYHARMMKYIWNLNPTDFSHLCPYWWLSILNHLIFIPYFAVRITLKIIVKIFSRIGDLFLWMIEGYINHMRRLEEIEMSKEIDYYKKHPEELVKLNEKKRKKVFEYSKGETYSYLREKFEQENNKVIVNKLTQEVNEKLERIRTKFLRLYKEPDRNNFLDDIDYMTAIVEKLEREEIERLRAIEMEKVKAAKKRINKILKIVKPILTGMAYLIGFVIALIVLYYGYKGVVYVVNAIGNIKHKTWVEFGNGLKICGKWLLVIVGAAVVLFLLIKLISKIKFKVNVKIPTKGIGTFFGWVGFPFAWVWNKVLCPVARAIKNFILLTGKMIKNECPAIEWKD